MDFKVESYTGKYINKTDYHLYIAPDKQLENIVAHYTITYPNPEAKAPVNEVLNLIPDVSGCFVYYLWPDLSIKVWGPTTEVVTVKNDLKTAPCRFFIEFLPAGLYQVLGISMDQLLDKKIPLEELMLDLFNEINESLLKMESFDEIVELMNKILSREVKKHQVNQDILNYLHSSQFKKLNGKELSLQLNLSERQINRYFNRYVGMGIKRYSKLVNINHLIKDLVDKNLLDLTFDYQYFDQAHFNHTFKEICGTSPTHYLDNLSEFYNELYKF